ncbi:MULTISPECIES: helix-turn-helix domain-containing protein [Haloferax]|uniref:Transcriptional regulator n=2 Tax=Haloferax TaxID=2251 RepID=A0A6G1Z4H4_9EURY|nr:MULTISPECIES: helix-turn-helix domain-containing protein [Haloferax]KAB1188738.1 transcriptional regulator [Haloferax sp. CBA1149]MRW81450.1 transcriptional regulator [Haloferax marinisediminis]
MSERMAGQGTRLTLDLWHPNCWAIEATSEQDGGILAHAIYDAPTGEIARENGRTNGLFTAYGDSTEEVQTLLDTIADSELTGDVLELQERFDSRGKQGTPGSVAREFFLEYDPGDMINPYLLEQGFIHSAPARIQEGRELWQVWYAGERSEIRDRIATVMDESGADIRVQSITSAEGAEPEREQRLDTLTQSQRQAFELAREEGYYRWPREVSTRELASMLDISKTTLLEHLRKAESKLLDPQ